MTWRTVASVSILCVAWGAVFVQVTPSGAVVISLETYTYTTAQHCMYMYTHYGFTYVHVHVIKGELFRFGTKGSVLISGS